MNKYKLQCIIQDIGNRLYESIDLELTFGQMCEVVAFLKLVKEEAKENANTST